MRAWGYSCSPAAGKHRASSQRQVPKRRCSSRWGLARLDTLDRGRGDARPKPKRGRASRVKYGVMYVSSLW